jgi:ATP-dependent RNA helicase DDX3X
MSDAGTIIAPDEAAIARKEQLAADLARAKEAGWDNPVPFKYEPVADGAAVPDETRDSAPWLSDAAIYQWDDEFGDVGEPNPDLEKMLFEDPHMQRVGQQIKALSFDVQVEGPDPVKPVRNVSLFPIVLYSH